MGHVSGEHGDVSNLRAALDATTWIASITLPTSATCCATQATQPGDGSRRARNVAPNKADGSHITSYRMALFRRQHRNRSTAGVSSKPPAFILRDLPTLTPSVRTSEPTPQSGRAPRHRTAIMAATAETDRRACDRLRRREPRGSVEAEARLAHCDGLALSCTRCVLGKT